MDSIPVRRKVTSSYRTVLYFFEKWLPLPNINPTCYNTLALVLSALYIYAATPTQKIGVVAIVLMTDWLDGATARRYAHISRGGYLIDVITDRASEAFIFAAAVGSPLGQAFFLLWIINTALTYYSARTNMHTALPLRFVYLLVLIAQV